MTASKPSPQVIPTTVKRDADKVQIHPAFGPALPEANWVPAPRYLMRRDLVLKLFGTFEPGRVLEFGCGSGALLAELAGRGFSGTGIEQSETALHLARRMTVAHPEISIHADAGDQGAESYDFLAAFEVLEHIEDDRGTLAAWAGYLRPGGTAILSVPAHPERWNPADVWAGHFRRYRREDLHALAEAAGLIVEDVICYGFPFANLMERLAAPVYARQLAKPAKDNLDQAGRTGESGTDRRLLTRLWPIYSAFPARHALQGALALQRRFLGSDRGIGYILIARKP
ncbi:MAG: class I SAM-dependent methyltransferase [Rhodobacterales bacterium]|nr:class I SAM-dependent methyltransferase [Rhodobacterales bacterium]